MDPRSASTGPLDDPRGALVHLAEQAGTAFENFASTRQRTRSELDRLATALEDAQVAGGRSIVVFGSWAREELTPESDDDWALLAAEPFDPDDPAICAGMEVAATVLGAEDEQDVGLLLDEAQRREVVDRAAVERRLRREVNCSSDWARAAWRTAVVLPADAARWPGLRRRVGRRGTGC